jgi:hypothetical protein
MDGHLQTRRCALDWPRSRFSARWRRLKRLRRRPDDV